MSYYFGQSWHCQTSPKVGWTPESTHPVAWSRTCAHTGTHHLLFDTPCTGLRLRLVKSAHECQVSHQKLARFCLSSSGFATHLSYHSHSSHSFTLSIPLPIQIEISFLSSSVGMLRLPLRKRVATALPAQHPDTVPSCASRRDDSARQKD